MRSPTVATGNTVQASHHNTVRDDAKASATLLAHEKSTPDLQLYVEPGTVYFGTTKVNFAGGNSANFTAPATNPRIDALCLNKSGALVRIAGAEAVSPTAPKIPSYYIPICYVYNRVGQTTIRDADTTGQGYIYQEIRHFQGLQLDLDTATITYNEDGSINTLTDTDTGTVYTFTYTSDGNVNTISDTSFTWTFAYTNGLLSGITKA